MVVRAGPHINTSLFSRQEKQEERDRQTEEEEEEGYLKRETETGIAKMKGCIKRPEWSMTMIHNRTYLSVLMS